MEYHLSIQIQHFLKNSYCFLWTVMHMAYLYYVQHSWTSFMNPVSDESYTETNIVILTKWFITGCIRSCQNDNFRCSQWWFFFIKLMIFPFHSIIYLHILLCYIGSWCTGQLVILCMAYPDISLVIFSQYYGFMNHNLSVNKLNHQ